MGGSLLGGGNSNMFGNFTPKIGEMIQLGWFNHQLVLVTRIITHFRGIKQTMQMVVLRDFPEKIVPWVGNMMTPVVSLVATLVTTVVGLEEIR